jgi:glycosyltransferase involved in cell wall biosynthesis
LLAAPLFLFVKKVYCYASDGLDFGKKHFPVFNKAKIELLPASVDTRIFYNEHLNKDDDRLKILIVARMVPFKRYEDLLRAIKIIKEEDRFDFVLNIRGDGPLEGEINLLIDKLEIRDRINFIPPMPNEKLREIYNQNDILVLPSFNEAIGIVAPEAMASGVPVVISDTCGSKTYVKNGINGYIFKTFDHFDLAEKITMLAYDERRAEMSVAAEKTIKEEFDSRLIANLFFEKIKDLL